MKLDPGIHIVIHSVLSLKPGVTETTRENKSDSIANKEESERSKGKQVSTEEAPDNTVTP